MARKTTKDTADKSEKQETCTAAYIRVSTEKQADEGFSLEAQTARVTAYCAAQGWRLCAEHIYIDAGLSGKTTERPEFQRLLEASRAKRIGRVVTVKLDRVARNTRDFLATVDALTAAGCSLVIIKEAFDTSTPHGKFALTLFAAMAELEISMIAERTMSGRQQKAQEAGNNGAPVPFGYDYDAKTFTPNKHAETVRSIFADYLAGVSMRKIAERLNAAQTPTAKGGKWYASTVAYVLHNGFYAGLVQYDGAEVAGGHPALVSLEDYERAQEREVVKGMDRTLDNLRAAVIG